MKIDFLHDAPPAALEKLRLIVALPQLQAVSSFLIVSGFVIACGWGLECAHVSRVRATIAQLESRVARSSISAARVRMEATSLTSEERVDEYVRTVRSSGARMASRIARLANELPERSWLTSIRVDSEGLAIDGRALKLHDVSEALASIGSAQLIGVRASHQADDRIMNFQLRVPDAVEPVR